MRPLKEQKVSEREECLDATGACVVDLTSRVELSQSARGNLVCDQETAATAGECDDLPDPIEFITENGFSIIRPWESGNMPSPAGGKFCFEVSDGFIERRITVQISRDVATEIELRARGRILSSNSFWIACAERHLANYLLEHADFPDDDELIVKELNREDVLLAHRWECPREEV